MPPARAARCSGISTRRTSDSAPAGTSLQLSGDAEPTNGDERCWPAGFTPRKICASKPPTRPKRARRGAVAPRRRRHLRLGPPLLLRGPQRQLRRARAADSRSRGSAVVAGVGAGVTRVKVGDKVAGQPVACVRPLRLLPRRPRATVPQDALPRQRQPLPARAGHVQRIFRHGRAAVLSRGRRHLAGRARVRRAAGGGAARGQSRRRSDRQVGADHRRRHDRLRDGHGGAARRRAQDHGIRHSRPAARAGEAKWAPMRRCAPIARRKR